MPTYREDKFDKEKAYKRVLWGMGSKVLDVELTELQKIMSQQMAELGGLVVSDGFRNRTPLVYSSSAGGTLTVPADTIVIGGVPASFKDPMVLTGVAGKTVYLASSEVSVSHSDTIRRDGNQSGGAVVADNGILDASFGGETSKRVQLQIELVTSNADAKKTYLPIASITASGTLTDLRKTTDVKSREAATSAIVKAGTQIVQGGNVPALALPKVDGRTLINLIGDAGNCEVLSLLSYASASGTLSLDSVNKVVGTHSVKMTAISSSAFGAYKDIAIDSAAKHYIALADVKNGDATSLNVRFCKTDYTPLVDSALITDSSMFKTYYTKISPSELAGLSAVRLYIRANSSPIGSSANVDAIRIYEITAAEYAAIDSMTAEQVVARYPYVGTGIHGVKDATITAVQDNLLPAFSDPGFYVTGIASVKNPYDVTASYHDWHLIARYSLEVKPQEQYSLSCVREGEWAYITFQYIDSTGASLGYSSGNLDWDNETLTATVPNGTVRLDVLFITGAEGTATFKNPMLVKGNTPQSFKPQAKSTLTAYAELHSNADGSVKDTLEYMNGKPKKVKRWEKVVLDGALGWQFDVNYVGFKRVKIAGFLPKVAQHDGLFQMATKYDGKQMPFNGSVNTTDSFFLNSTSDIFYINIPNADSGWGDAYSPTAAEIKAYFNGWRMVDSETGGLYTPGKDKSWINLRGEGVDGYINDDAPTHKATGAVPYYMLYQLASPIIEDAHTSGAIVLEAGDNHVTVNSANVPLETASLTYADSVYSSLGDVAREVDTLSFRVSENGFISPKLESESGEVYPIGVTSMSVNQGTYNFPYAGHVINNKPTLTAMSQTLHERGFSRNKLSVRKWGLAEGWSAWTEIFTGDNAVGNRRLRLTAGTYTDLDVSQYDFVSIDTSGGDVVIHNLLMNSSDRRVRFVKTHTVNSIRFVYSNTLGMNTADAKDLVMGTSERYGIVEAQQVGGGWFLSLISDWGNKHARSDNSNLFGTTTGSGTAFNVTIPAVTALTKGLKITVEFHIANTGNATLNASGLGAKSIVDTDGSVIGAGGIKKGFYDLVYTGTAFQLSGKGGGKDYVIRPGIRWDSSEDAYAGNWSSVCYGNGRFVAVTPPSTGSHYVMTSEDGDSWYPRSAPAGQWISVTYGAGTFVAVSSTGGVMTSPDGITWTARTAASGMTSNGWTSVCYGKNMFVAVSISGATNRVMTSPNGITWTARTTPVAIEWTSVCFGNNMFVAVARTGTGRIMTSTDGITWTLRTAPAMNSWQAVTYGNGAFVAVSDDGSGNRVMTSTNGTTWSIRTGIANNSWRAICYAMGIFVAVGYGANYTGVMTSVDNGATWTVRESSTDGAYFTWNTVCYGHGMFIALTNNEEDYYLMKSGMALS